MDSDYREDERRRREAAQASTAEVLGGRAVPQRALKQMLSVRLEPDLLQDLRLFADQHDMSVSDVLRQAAVEFLNRTRRVPFVATVTTMQHQKPISVIWSQGSQTGTGLVGASRSQVASLCNSRVQFEPVSELDVQPTGGASPGRRKGPRPGRRETCRLARREDRA
jgi:hypothetical protein